MSNRSGGRNARKKKRQNAKPLRRWSSPVNNRYRPLADADVQKVHAAALTLLADVGMASPTTRVAEAAVGAGATFEGGRLKFPPSMVEKYLGLAARAFTVHGRDPRHDFEAKSGEINFCTGGAAVKIMDPGARDFRPSVLNDLLCLARVCDQLDNIQWFARPVVATDVADPYELDVNTIYAAAAGTQKHIATSFSSGDHVKRSLDMLDLLAGGSFRKRPFCTVHATTVVSPMTFAPDSLDVAVAALEIGMPVHVQTGPQAGATAPATLAGCLAQVCAEGLASLTVMQILKPGHPVILGNWAFTSDLRTGAFAGGGAEAALLGAASGQMSNFYGIPGGMGAGMTDSKLPDNQAGFEKGLSVALAALSGGGFVFESAGMLASLLGCSLEAMVIDDEMLGMIRRIGRGIEVSDEALALDLIAETVHGPGHFLGAEQTLKVMETEFDYPILADRQSPDDWVQAGATDIRERAAQKVRSILGQTWASTIDPITDQAIRAAYPIYLEPKVSAA